LTEGMAEGCWRFRCIDCGTLLRWRGKISDRPPCPTCRPPQSRTRSLDLNTLEYVQDALDQCNRMLAACRGLPRLSRSGTADVRRTVEGIRARAERFMQVTIKQPALLDTIEDQLGRMTW